MKSPGESWGDLQKGAQGGLQHVSKRVSWRSPGGSQGDLQDARMHVWKGNSAGSLAVLQHSVVQHSLLDHQTLLNKGFRAHCVTAV